MVTGRRMSARVAGAAAGLLVVTLGVAACGPTSSVQAPSSDSTPSPLATAKGNLPPVESPIHPFRAHLLLCLTEGKVWPVGTPADRAMTLLTAGRDYLAGRGDSRSASKAEELTRAIDEISASGQVTELAHTLIAQGCS